MTTEPGKVSTMAETTSISPGYPQVQLRQATEIQVGNSAYHRLVSRCGSLCWIFGISGDLPITCIEPDGHEGEHKTTIGIAKPPARFTVSWTEDA